MRADHSVNVVTQLPRQQAAVGLFIRIVKVGFCYVKTVDTVIHLASRYSRQVVKRRTS